MRGRGHDENFNESDIFIQFLPGIFLSMPFFLNMHSSNYEGGDSIYALLPLRSFNLSAQTKINRTTTNFMAKFSTFLIKFLRNYPSNAKATCFKDEKNITFLVE